jgi:endo-1,4-beta-D-glucanase Y
MLNASRLLLLQTAPRGFRQDWIIYQTTPQQTASFSPDIKAQKKAMAAITPSACIYGRE